MNPLLDSVQFIKGVGPERCKTLNRLGIHTIRDLLYYFPRTYLDRTKIKTIADVLKDGKFLPTEEQTITGKILAITLQRTRRGINVLQIAVGDDTGIIYATWFNQPFLKKNFQKGDEIILSGRIKYYKQPFLESPEYEIIRNEEQQPLHSGGIIPCYPLTAGIGQKYLRLIVKRAMEKYANHLVNTIDFIPEHPANLLPIAEAVKQIHFPESEANLKLARDSIVWEELFLLQLSMAQKYYSVKKSPVKYQLKLSEQLDSRIRSRFERDFAVTPQRIPFVLTPAQEKVIAEIKEDLVKPYPMNRLLQGDVGSGKTIVAVYAILAAIGNHTQAALMAPTEILAEQHYQTISRILENSQVRIVLLTSGIKKKERLEKLELISKGEIDLVIGTHALIQKDIVFNKLALMIIDEQHKFGVEQRETLRAKGENPHTIVMTATPIPQTLTFTIFGDLDLSVIDQLPPGRKPVKTILRSSAKLAEAFSFIRQKIHEGRQVYFVYPVIYEQRAKSEEQVENKVVLKSATQMAKQLKAQVFPEYNIKLLHGEMSEKKKDEIMRNFRAGKINILVSTVVIEVGIDVPNACVMVIDHAERYGLAQLHQLRGRIGRGAYNSYCLLFGDVTTPESEKRLGIMEETNDGFRIAEEDLRIRGPGEFLGKRQSGFPEFKIADLSRDLEILKKVRQSAFTLIKQDPQLIRYPYLKHQIPVNRD